MAEGILLFLTILVAFSGINGDSTPSLTGVLFKADTDNLVKLFQRTKIDNLETAFYVARGLSALGSAPAEVKKNACNFIKNSAPSPTNLADTFYALSVKTAFECPVALAYSKELKETLSSGTHNITEYYYIVSSLVDLKQTVDDSMISLAKISELAEVEDKITSYGQAFLTGALIEGEGVYTPLMELIEDVVAQADETPTTLYYEGGLEQTALVVMGSFALGKRAGNSPAITDTQVTLFTNYIASLRLTDCVKEAYYVATALQVLASNQFSTPVGLFPVDKRPVSNTNKDIKFNLVNAVGASVTGSTVTIVSVTGSDGKQTSIGKPLTASKDGSVHSYPLYNDVNTPGRYTVTLRSEAKGDSPVTSIDEVKFPVTVGLSAVVDSAQLLLLEKDQNVAVKTLALNYPDTSKEQLSADQHSKVKMTFKLLNKDNRNVVTAHQVFVQLVGSGGEDIFFVAMPSEGGEYTFELDVASASKESFGSKSGAYAMHLIVGGDTILNPIIWNVGTLNLKFGDTTGSVGVSEEEEYRYKPKPTIEHLFAVPEKRPPQVISMTFSVLIMAPLFILLVIWLILGANVSKIGSAGPWAMLFHLGLASIFVLYYYFWVKLDMFQTLKYLVFIGGITFFAGNRMLKSIAKHNKV